MRGQRREIVGVVIHVVAVADLAGAAVAAAVMGDDAKAVVEEEQHLRVPVVGRQRPAVAEHDRLARAPVLVEDLDAVLGGDGGHGNSPLCCVIPGHASTRGPGIWMSRSSSGSRVTTIGQAYVSAGRNRRDAPMITRTKNTSTMPCTTANTGPAGGSPGASAVQRRHLQEALDHQHEHVEVKRDQRGQHIDPAPRAGELHAVERDAGDRQQHQRENADHVRRQQLLGQQRRNQEAGGAGQDREQQEDRGQARHPVRAEHPEHHDHARDDRDQADDDMHENKRRQAHTQNHDALPSWKLSKGYDAVVENFHTHRVRRRQCRHVRE